MLGTLIDSVLTMIPLIDKLLVKVKPKVRALTRMRHLYSHETLLNQFKTHIWGHSEYSNGAIILAKTAHRNRIDKMQRGFLYDIGMCDTEAFV